MIRKKKKVWLDEMRASKRIKMNKCVSIFFSFPKINIGAKWIHSSKRKTIKEYTHLNEANIGKKKTTFGYVLVLTKTIGNKVFLDNFDIVYFVTSWIALAKYALFFDVTPAIEIRPSFVK